MRNSRRLLIVLPIALGFSCVTVRDGTTEPSFAIRYSTGGVVSIISELNVFRPTNRLVLNSGFCRGGVRSLSSIEMEQLVAAAAQIETVARDAEAAIGMEAASIEVEYPGEQMVLMELRGSIPERLSSALDVVDEIIRRKYREKCGLDPAKPWKGVPE